MGGVTGSRGRKGRGLDVQAKLEDELRRVERRLRLSLGLTVVWRHQPSNPLSGEVRGDTVYVYDEDPEKALETLRHEVIDHLITSRIVKPLVGLVNLLIKDKEAEVYRDKERLVEALANLLNLTHTEKDFNQQS